MKAGNLCPMLDYEGQRAHAAVNLTVKSQHLRVPQSQLVVQGDIALQPCHEKHRTILVFLRRWNPK